MKNNQYLKVIFDGKKFKPIMVPPSDRYLDQLPAGVYEFYYSESMNGPDYGFVRISEQFTIPSNVVHQNEELNRVLNTYSSMNKSMGALFSGVGGTGKTLLCKRIANECISVLKMPVIFVTEKNAEHIYLILESLTTPVVFIFDEFEKIYPVQKGFHNDKDDAQNKFLSILDGMELEKHLFLVTINETNKMNEFLLNRPSRIRYHFNFKTIPIKIVEEIVDKHYLPLVDEYKEELIVLFTDHVGKPTYDVLFEMINECNLYKDKSPFELIQTMNIQLTVYTAIKARMRFDYDLQLTNEEKEKYKDILKGMRLKWAEDRINPSFLELRNISRDVQKPDQIGFDVIELTWGKYIANSGATFVTNVSDECGDIRTPRDKINKVYLKVRMNHCPSDVRFVDNLEEYQLFNEFAKRLFDSEFYLLLEARSHSDFIADRVIEDRKAVMEADRDKSPISKLSAGPMQNDDAIPY